MKEEVVRGKPLRLLAFSDWRVQNIDKLIDHVEKLEYQLDAIVYAGDDIRRFSRKEENLFSKLGKHTKHGVLAVVGNDDTRDCKRVLKARHAHDLHEKPYITNGYAFIGQEGSTGEIGVILYSENEVYNHLKAQMRSISKGKTIILVSHSPPYGILDFARRFGNRHIGSRAILNFLKKHDIALNICGHVHMYGGKTEEAEDTRVLNISSQDIPGASSKLAEIIFFNQVDRGGRVWPIIRCYSLEEKEIRNYVASVPYVRKNC